MSLFNANTIGAHVNAILKKHGEDVLDGVSFEEQVKNSSRVFKYICTMIEFVPGSKRTMHSPRNRRVVTVEAWIEVIHRELKQLFQSSPKWTEQDWMVVHFIHTALKLEYRDIYYDYFD